MQISWKTLGSSSNLKFMILRWSLLFPSKFAWSSCVYRMHMTRYMHGCSASREMEKLEKKVCQTGEKGWNHFLHGIRCCTDGWFKAWLTVTSPSCASMAYQPQYFLLYSVTNSSSALLSSLCFMIDAPQRLSTQLGRLATMGRFSVVLWCWVRAKDKLPTGVMD